MKKKEIFQWVLCLIIVVALVFVFRNFVFQRNRIDGNSMETTFSDGDGIIVEKLSYELGNPKRFDVIVFYPFGKKEGDYFIKRIIGMPGEIIQIREGKIYINGEILEEDYGNSLIDYSGIAEQPYKIDDGKYFVMGDNRIADESFDSRYEEIGAVDRKLIGGKAILRISPISKFKIIKK